MTTLFDDINLFDEGFHAKRREAVAVAHKRVQDRVGAYLKIAKSPEEYDARLDFVSDDVRQIIADVSEEFSVDHDKLADAIDDALKGDGVTDLNEELADAPSAVGQKASGGHKPGCECGFCKNKGKLPGSKKEDDSSDSDSDSGDDSSDDDGDDKPDFLDKDSSAREADVQDPGYYQDGPIAAEQQPGQNETQCPDCGGMGCEACQGKGTIPFQVDPGFQQSLNDLVTPQPIGFPPGRGASTKMADAPKEGGGAVKTEKLPKGKGDAVGYGASPKIDKKEWKPNALNDSGNLKPVDAEMSGSPAPTVEQDLVDDKPDYEGDFLRDTDAVTTQADLPSADETGQSTERNLSQEGQSGTWTEVQGDAVTSEVFSSTDPDVNPLKAILESGFATDNQVESAIREFKSE